MKQEWLLLDMHLHSEYSKINKLSESKKVLTIQYSPIKTEDGAVTNNKEIKKLKKKLAQTKEELEI